MVKRRPVNEQRPMAPARDMAGVQPTLHALVDSSGVVVNLIMADPSFDPGVGFTIVDATPYPGVAIGWVYQGGALSPQPTFTMASTAANGITTVTATLNSPPAAPPATATFTIGADAITAPLSGSPLKASIELAVDSILAGASVACEVSAPGCVGSALQLGSSGGPQVGVQAIAPGATGNGNPSAYRVATTSIDYTLGAPAGMVSAPRQLNAMAVALHILVHMVVKLAKQANLATYAPIGWTADEDNALNDLDTSMVPLLALTLANAYPAGGSPAAIYAQWKADMPAFQAAIQDANTLLAGTPNVK